MSPRGFLPGDAEEGRPYELPVRNPGEVLAAAEAAEAEEIITDRDVQIAAAVRNENHKGGVY